MTTGDGTVSIPKEVQRTDPERVFSQNQVIGSLKPKSKIFLYFFLSSLSLLGEGVFLYFISIIILQFPHGGKLSGLIITMDSLLEIGVGPFIAHRIDAITTLIRRLQCSIWIHGFLLFFSIVPILLIPFINFNLFGIFTLVAVGRFCLLVDNQLKAALPLSLEKQGRFPLIQSLSFSTLSHRSMPLLGSSLAPFLLGCSWVLVFLIKGLAAIAALTALLILIKIMKSTSPSCVPSFSLEQRETVKPFLAHERKRWTNWYNGFLFFSTLAFGAIILILNRSMLDHEGSLKALYGPAPLYAGMVVSISFIFFFFRKKIAVVSHASWLLFFCSAISVGLIVTSFMHSYGFMIALFSMGIANGFSIIFFSTFAQVKFDGDDFVAISAKNQAFRRAGFLISVNLAGFAIDKGASPPQLLLCCGIAGVICVLTLFYSSIRIKAFHLVDQA